jgi:hypothetical protein
LRGRLRRLPCATRRAGRLAELGPSGLRQRQPTSPGPSALLGASQGGRGRSGTACGQGCFSRFSFLREIAALCALGASMLWLLQRPRPLSLKTVVRSPSKLIPSRPPHRNPRCANPLRGAAQRRTVGRSRRALSVARRAEFRQPPDCPSSAGKPRRGHRPRVAFSLATFFWRSKRKYARASGAEHSGKKTQTPGRSQVP